MGFSITKLPDYQITISALPRFASVLIQNLVHFFRRQVFMKVVVHLCRRRPAACAQALHVLEREQAVWGRAFVADAELFLSVLDQFVRATQQTRNIPAYLNVELPARLGGQHRVIADHVTHVEFSQIQPPRDFRDHCV